MTCGTGLRTRSRDCDGEECPGSPRERLLCARRSCTAVSSACSRAYWVAPRKDPSDRIIPLPLEVCVPSEWLNWGACGSSCGAGVQSRRRSDGCGPSADYRACQSGPCPEWLQWNRWGGCSKSCGEGRLSFECLLEYILAEVFVDALASAPSPEPALVPVR